MVYYYNRYGKRYYRRYRKYRRFYRRYRRNYSRRYVNASSRSSVRMKTATNWTFPVTAGYGDAGTGAVVQTTLPLNSAVGDPNAVTNAPLFRVYCNLYEECKMIGARINLAIVSAVGGTDIPSLQIYTAWDRKRGFGEPAFSVADIKNASTSAVSTALNNNVAKIVRSCYASDLMENCTWFDSALDSSNGNRNIAWVTAGTNPNMFCPSFSFYLNCPSKGATTSVNVSMSVVYYFAFRNPRFGGSGSAKSIDLGPRAASDPDAGGDADGGNMVDHEDLADDPDMIDSDEDDGALHGAGAIAAAIRGAHATSVQTPAKRSHLNK